MGGCLVAVGDSSGLGRRISGLQKVPGGTLRKTNPWVTRVVRWRING